MSEHLLNIILHVSQSLLQPTFYTINFRNRQVFYSNLVLCPNCSLLCISYFKGEKMWTVSQFYVEMKLSVLLYKFENHFILVVLSSERGRGRGGALWLNDLLLYNSNHWLLTALTVPRDKTSLKVTLSLSWCFPVYNITHIIVPTPNLSSKVPVCLARP